MLYIVNVATLLAAHDVIYMLSCIGHKQPHPILVTTIHSCRQLLVLKLKFVEPSIISWIETHSCIL